VQTTDPLNRLRVRSAKSTPTRKQIFDFEERRPKIARARTGMDHPLIPAHRTWRMWRSRRAP